MIADEETVTARSQGAPYMIMLAITGIDTSALMRVTPYTMVNGVKRYDSSTSYLINPKSGVLTTSDVIKLSDSYVAEAYIQNFSEAFESRNNGDGYSLSSTPTWRQVINPDYVMRWGGQRIGSVSYDADTQSAKFSVGAYGTGYWVATETVKDNGDGTTTSTWTYAKGAESACNIKDANGKKLVYSSTMGGRSKFAYVIPADIDYEKYIGSTLVITARVKVSEISTVTNQQVDGYLNGVKITDQTFAVPTQSVNNNENAVVDIGIGFWSDGDTGAVTNGAAKTQSIAISDGWIEITTSLAITKSYYDTMMGKTKQKVTDSDGKTRLYPLRPTITFGSSTRFASKIYIDDITCYIIPTAN